MDLDIRGLALETAQRLVDHHPRMRQAVALAGGTARKQQGTHAARLADTGGRDVGLDELHGVVDGHPGSHRTTRRVDVEMNVLLGIFSLQEQQLGNHQVGHVVLDLADQEDDPFLQQARIDVVGALAAGGLLHHHGHQATGGLDIGNVRNKRVARHVLRSLPNR